MRRSTRHAVRRWTSRPVGGASRQCAPAEPDAQLRLASYYDTNAAVYDRWMRFYDRWMLGDGRRLLCAAATGRTLEVGVGTGLNLPWYGPSAAVVGLDHSTGMLQVASVRSTAMRFPLVRGDACRLPFPGSTFDTVLSTLFLSSAPEPNVAAREMHRVLRPGGTLLVIDHGVSQWAPVKLLEMATFRFVHQRTGVDLRIDPAACLGSAGFHVTRARRSRLGIVHTITATKPTKAGPGTRTV